MKFQDFQLSWRGRSYTIPANKMMQVIARIEDHITLGELAKFQQDKGTLPFAKLSNAFAEVINFAGGQVDAQDVYSGLCGGGAEDEQKIVGTAVSALLLMMTPPDVIAKAAKIKAGAAGEAGAAPVAAVKKASRKRFRP